MNLAIIKDGKVVNTVSVSDVWTGVDGEWQPPVDAIVVPSEDASIDDLYDGQQITSIRGPKPGKVNLEHEEMKQKAQAVIQSAQIPKEIKEFVSVLIKRVN